MVRYNGYGIVPEAFDDYSKIVVQPEPSPWDSGILAGQAMSLIKAQAELVVEELRCIYESRFCLKSDRIAVKSMIDYLGSILDRPMTHPCTWSS